jgi:hypothetical protein
VVAFVDGRQKGGSTGKAVTDSRGVADRTSGATQCERFERAGA